MADECSPVGVMAQCWQPAVLRGFLTAAEVPALPQAEGMAASSLCSEALVELKAVKFCVNAARLRLSKRTGGGCRVALSPLERGYRDKGVTGGFVFCQGLAEYCTLIDSSSSFRAYRAALADVEPPCIPYL